MHALTVSRSTTGCNYLLLLLADLHHKDHFIVARKHHACCGRVQKPNAVHMLAE